MKQHSTPVQRATPARMIIADDHELARAGLRNMLESDRGLRLVGEATNGREAVVLCRELQPDLALLDVRMPDMDGLAATREIRQACPQTCVLIVTTHANPDYLLAALKAGAAGYVLKDVTRQDLLNTIRRVLRGEAVLSKDIDTQALQRLAGQPTGPASATPERLTPREREVLEHIVEGHTNREIARQLSLSVGTVKIHVEHIIAKLGVADRTQAAVRAVERGLLRALE
ncbi:MAG TPA: response regulator transcription factor [Roseiflexaceae bacterium]|nr:response regulator transcription factor [Roseiflexaceae bacterium]